MGCYIWYSKEGTGRGRSPPRPLLAVPNVTAHPSTASVPITLTLYNGPLFCGFSVPIKGSDSNTPTQNSMTKYSKANNRRYTGCSRKKNAQKNVQKLFANVNKQPAQRAWSSLPTRLASARHQPTQRDHGYGLVYHAMCMFTRAAFAGYSYRLSTEGWLRPSRPGPMVLRRGGLHIQRRSPIQALTGPGVE